MSKKIHFNNGCPWANGGLYSSDTNQTDNWDQVTCKHCRRLRYTGWDPEATRLYAGPYA